MKTEKQIFLTKEGFLNLEEELNDLKLNKRPEVTQSLKEARALGDLSENAEYDQAKTDQEILEKRISELEYELENATIIDDKISKDAITVGSTVEIMYDGDPDDTEIYRIVGSREADPFNNKISNESPIAVAIMNKKVGQKVEVASPDGVYTVEIKKIS